MRLSFQISLAASLFVSMVSFGGTAQGGDQVTVFLAESFAAAEPLGSAEALKPLVDVPFRCTAHHALKGDAYFFYRSSFVLRIAKSTKELEPGAPAYLTTMYYPEQKHTRMFYTTFVPPYGLTAALSVPTNRGGKYRELIVFKAQGKTGLIVESSTPSTSAELTPARTQPDTYRALSYSVCRATKD